jgi:hypothetical protein
MSSRNRITAGLAAVTVAFALGACDDSSPSSPSDPSSVSSPATVEPLFANNSRQTGLVNVSTGEVDLLNNVNLAVAANVILTVCGLTVPVAALAEQLVLVGPYECSGDAGPITIDQATPGEGPAPAGGNNSNQEGLINVSLGDVAILNDVNVAVAANVLVTACGLTIPVAILAAQAVGTAPFECPSEAGAIDIVQSQG